MSNHYSKNLARGQITAKLHQITANYGELQQIVINYSKLQYFQKYIIAKTLVFHCVFAILGPCAYREVQQITANYIKLEQIIANYINFL